VRYVEEFRDAKDAQALLAAIQREADRPITIMEICGGQTHTLLRYGIDQLLPETVTLVHGPGCPVCVTDAKLIDAAIELARRPEVILTSFGDMLRVPGSTDDLLSAKAQGADVRMVYSPLDALTLARANPQRRVIFFAIGFETTAPAHALAVVQAQAERLDNFSIISALVRVPPAMEAILGAKDNLVEAFLAAGHVCTVMGYWEYEPIATRFCVPIVVTGFEPLDLLQGILMAVTAKKKDSLEVQNQYRRAVTRDGNRIAQTQLNRVFATCDRDWRGIGTIPASGLGLRPEWKAYDALADYVPTHAPVAKDSGCIAGVILQGQKKPPDCPLFATRCTPEHPVGAPMVSSEGACAAYYRYARKG